MIINNLFLSDTVQTGFLYLMLCLSGFCSLLLMRISITDSDHALKIGKILNLGRTGLFCTGVFLPPALLLRSWLFVMALVSSKDLSF